MANDGDNHQAKSSLFGELWWGVAVLVRAGGALLGLEHAGEQVCLLCLRLVFTIRFFHPFAFSLGWNFLDANNTLQRICAPSIWGEVKIVICFKIAHLVCLVMAGSG